MKRMIYLLVLCVLLTGCAKNKSGQYIEQIDTYENYDSWTEEYNEEYYEEPYEEEQIVYALSDDCDYVLCSGTDVVGDYYELVANQTESSLGYELTVGIIKNNEWIYPLSSNFPFLGSDGLFHVGGTSLWESSGSDLSQYGRIAESMYFLDSGTFMFEWSKTSGGYSNPQEKSIFFNCNTFAIEEVYQDVHYLRQKAKVDWNEGVIKSHGHMYTDDGNVLMTEYDFESKTYDWYIFDTETFTTMLLVSDMDIRPENILSDGLIFAEDQCFYNTSMEKVIDLSMYNLLSNTENKVYFEFGKCTFEAYNDLGTGFYVTIDKYGNVINERQMES